MRYLPRKGQDRGDSLERGMPTVAYARPVLTAAEIRVARLVAGLSRRVGAGAGMTVPGKLLSKLDPGAIDRLGRPAAGRRRVDLRDERQDDDGRDGRRDPAAAVPARPQPLGREPRLGRRLHAPRRRRCRARPARGRRGGAARGAPARPAAGRLPRQSLPRPARPLRRARARGRALARGRRGARRRGPSSS